MSYQSSLALAGLEGCLAPWPVLFWLARAAGDALGVFARVPADDVSSTDRLLQSNDIAELQVPHSMSG